MKLALRLYRAMHRSKYPPNWRTIEKLQLKIFPRCEFCGSDKKLQVHHILPVHVHPELAAKESNLAVLCEPCHLRFGHLGDFTRWWDPDLRPRAQESFDHIRSTIEVERGD